MQVRACGVSYGVEPDPARFETLLRLDLRQERVHKLHIARRPRLGNDEEGEALPHLLDRVDHVPVTERRVHRVDPVPEACGAPLELKNTLSECDDNSLTAGFVDGFGSGQSYWTL